ncbi:MAG TPA: hypothetical protein DDY31_16080, partial [Lachnospiraceae bacterium]|nr:hypothetical protein [Lachnospiraceae bacterium]
MEMYEWIYQIAIEGIKYVLIAHWFLGFEFNRRKTKYLLLLYPLLIPVVEYLDIPHTVFLYRYLWGVLLLFFLFKRRLIEKVKAFFVIWFLVGLVDALILIVYFICTTVLFADGNMEMEMILGCVGAVFWIFLVWKCLKLQKGMQNFWNKLSNKEYVLLIIVLILLSFILGGMQSNLYGISTLSIETVRLISMVFAAYLFMVLLILFIYSQQSKKQLEKVNQLNVRYLKLQKRYYEYSLSQYEDMKKFRHDINHHIFILSELSREDKITELQEYIETMAEGYEKMRGIHTGNFIADCIISRVLHELKEKAAFQFELEGHFPETFFMEDIDFCILLSNLLENAKEAIEKVTGECFLQMEIKSFHQWFYLIVRNSVASKEIDFQRTSKADKRNHGFGVQNISR